MKSRNSSAGDGDKQEGPQWGRFGRAGLHRRCHYVKVAAKGSNENTYDQKGQCND